MAFAAMLMAAPMLAPSTAMAARPLDTEDTGTVEPGRAEAEVSVDYSRNPDDRSWLFGGAVTVGLLPRLEGRLESGVLLQDPDGEPARGVLGDTALRFKYRLLDEQASLPAVLGRLSLQFPTDREEPGQGPNSVDVGLLGVASKTLGDLTLTGNAGYTFLTSDRGLDYWTLGASVVWQITRLWAVVGELFSTLSAGGPDTALLRGGATYQVSERVRLDSGVAVGLTRESPDVSVTAGVTIGLF